MLLSNDVLIKMIVKELKIEPHWPLGKPDVNVFLNLPASHIFAQPNNNYI